MIDFKNLWENFFFYDGALFMKLSAELSDKLNKNAICLASKYIESKEGYRPIYEAGETYNFNPDIQVNSVDFVEAKWR